MSLGIFVVFICIILCWIYLTSKQLAKWNSCHNNSLMRCGKYVIVNQMKSFFQKSIDVNLIRFAWGYSFKIYLSLVITNHWIIYAFLLLSWAQCSVMLTSLGKPNQVLFALSFIYITHSSYSFYISMSNWSILRKAKIW